MVGFLGVGFAVAAASSRLECGKGCQCLSACGGFCPGPRWGPVRGLQVQLHGSGPAEGAGELPLRHRGPGGCHSPS
eukprot:7801993-Prorocentrum_lima.AAC.1